MTKNQLIFIFSTLLGVIVWLSTMFIVFSVLQKQIFPYRKHRRNEQLFSEAGHANCLLLSTSAVTWFNRSAKHDIYGWLAF